MMDTMIKQFPQFFIALVITMLTTAVTLNAQAVEVNSITPGYQDGFILLQINTEGDTHYRLSELSRNRLELTVYNTVHTDVEQSPSILWKFVPTRAINIHEDEGNTYITFRLKAHSSYEVFHEKTQNTIQLNIGGQLAQEFRRSVIKFGSQHFEQLAQDERETLAFILHEQEFNSRNSFLLNELSSALENGQILWYEELYREVRGRDPLTQDQLLQLGTFFEAQGDLAEAERTWFDYYQRAERQLNANYTDSLPESSLIQYSDSNSRLFQKSLAFMQGIFAQNFLISLFVVILVMAGSIGTYLLYREKFVNRSKDVEHQSVNESIADESPAENPFDSFLQEMQYNKQPAKEEETAKQHAVKSDQEGPDTEEPVDERKKFPEEPIYTSEAAEQSLEESPELVNPTVAKKNSILKQAEVIDLYKMSVEPEVIAKNLNMSRSEVELLLKISGSMANVPAAQNKRKFQYDDSYAEMSLNDMAQEMKISVEEAKLLRLKGQREHFSA